MIDPEIGFTSDVIRDPNRFVGRTDLIRSCIRALNSPVGLIAVYGKRGVGKSSLLRQIQQMALGDYSLAKTAGLSHELYDHPKTYLTVYYSCDSMINSGEELLQRLCNDQHAEDGLLRLIPDDGKEIVEFTRLKEASAGADLKVAKWGTKGAESTKYARKVEGDIVQTFRNFVSSIVSHQVQKRMGRDSLLILLDEFDVIRDKDGIGSLIKSLTSSEVKFGICGIGRDLADLVQDHASIERLLEQGAVDVRPMDSIESAGIITRAEILFEEKVTFDIEVKKMIAEISKGYPYFTQLIGKECILKANQTGSTTITIELFESVLEQIKSGKTFPTLEVAYQKAIGNSSERQILLHLLAEQPEDKALINDELGKVYLKKTRKEAQDFEIQHIDQLLPRLIDIKYGPVLSRGAEKQGVYEFVNPVFRLYVQLRTF